MQRIGRRIAGVGLALTVVLLLALSLTWSARAPIARDLIARELARRGVPARFKVATIGLRTQALADLVIGDPADPDLTARRGEVDVAVGIHGVTVRALRLDGVRLRGRIEDGRLRMGALDRLLPTTTAPGTPFTLPAIDLAINDGRMQLATAYGPVGLAFDGAGLLSDGFTGRVAVAADRLDLPGCIADRPRAVLHLAVDDRAPMLDGPVQADRLTCGAVRAEAPALSLDLRLGPALDRWRGGGEVGVRRIDVGAVTLVRVALQLGFEGTPAATRGGIDGRVEAARIATTTGRGATLDGRFVVSGGRGALDGKLRVDHVALPPDTRRMLRSVANQHAVHPAAAITRMLARNAATAGDDLALGADIAASMGAARSGVALTHLSVRSASGVSLASIGAARLLWTSAGGLGGGGRYRIGGGGLPDADLLLRQTPAGTIAGELRIAPMAAEGESLRFEPLLFAEDRGGTMRLLTAVTSSGPLPGGRVEGMRVPVDARIGGGTLHVNPACFPISWQRVELSTLTLDSGAARLCPVGAAAVSTGMGGLAITLQASPLRLGGKLGSSPLSLAADRTRLSLPSGQVAVGGLAAVLGNGADATRLTLGDLVGQMSGKGWNGRFAHAAGKLAAVPFLIDGAAGDWRFADGQLFTTIDARVIDAVAPARFRPMAVHGGHLTIGAGMVRLAARLAEPRSGATAATVAIVHDLSRGTGEALLGVDGLTFGPKLQPEALTPLTLGIVANVAGRVDGSGRVRWSPAGVTSEGSFTTAKLDLAAAFGPVSGIAGTIHFDDLVNLLTPPHQRATLALINPGVEVANGTIDYQLLPDRRVRVEQGLWPFAGGTLHLLPTTLDFAANARRLMTVDVAGLDGARFIEQMKFDNIAATGIFDGALPLVFDASGGRIVGGYLVARPGGGTLSYVGDVSNAQLGTYGKLAFDALKSLRYKTLRIDLDGALDGEIVSRVGVNGVNQAPVGASVRGMTKQLTGLPFKFNITVKAPFRGLMTSARAFADPTQLIGQQGTAATIPAVQPK